jgi:hypothetical protein
MSTISKNPFAALEEAEERQRSVSPAKPAKHVVGKEAAKTLPKRVENSASSPPVA